MSMELVLRYGKILALFALLWVGVWFFNNFGCSRVEGPEMSPTIPADKSVTIDPKTQTAEQLNRDDFVLFTYDSGKGPRKVAARVVGLPGDKVKIVKGEVFVNNEKQGLADKKSAEDYAEVVVPRNSVYVLCDNRASTRTIDSRSIGPVGTWAILGKVR